MSRIETQACAQAIIPTLSRFNYETYSHLYLCFSAAAPTPATPAPPTPAPPAPPTPAPPAPQPPATVAPSKPVVVYNIIVYTGSVPKQGSKAQAYITLYGALSSSSEIHLKSPTLESTVEASK